MSKEEYGDLDLYEDEGQDNNNEVLDADLYEDNEEPTVAVTENCAAKKCCKATQCAQSPNHEVAIEVQLDDSELTSTFLHAEGMSCCASCAATIEGHLRKVKGVAKVKVYFLSEKVEAIHDSSVSSESLAEILTSAGYKSTVLRPESSSRATLRILNESSRQHTIEKLLLQQKGVADARFVNKTGLCLVDVSFDPELTGPRDLIELLSVEGTESELYTENSTRTSSRGSDSRTWRNGFLLCLIFTIPLFIISIIIPLIKPIQDVLDTEILLKHLTVGVILELIITSPIQFIFAIPVYKSAWKGLKIYTPNMDLLITISTLSAYVYSIISLIASFIQPSYEPEFYFETSAFLMTLVMLGRYLEVVAIRSTSGALQKLVSLQSPTAILMKGYQEDNSYDEEQEIDINLVQRYDIIKVKPCSKIPIDGRVIFGSTTIDESMITGESLPVSKETGNEVIAGTMNQNGLIHVLVTKSVQETTLANIYKLVEEAQVSKTNVQRAADKLASYFVPFILILSIATFVIWLIVGYSGLYKAEIGVIPFALMFAMTVLVISCPCAISLSAPTAIMVATGMAAKMGILFKGAAVLENAYKVTTVVFDKTGTLTVGKPSVVEHFIDEEMKGNLSDKKFFYYIASAELGFKNHVLGEALVMHYQSQYLQEENEEDLLSDPTDFESTSGKGLKCNVDGRQVIVGNAKWLRENNVTITEKMTRRIEDVAMAARTIVCCAIDGNFAGFIGIADTLKPEAYQVVQYMKSKKINVWMLSGDNETTARHIAAEIGIDNVLSEVLPHEKSGKVKELQDNGEIVCMVGDGINDSIALTQANVGVAMGKGTEIAIESSDIVLLKDDLRDVVISLDLSKKTMTRIFWNFVWAFIYNVIGIPFAAGFLFPIIKWAIPPSIAGLSELLSSIPVILFSLLLKLYKPPSIPVV